jgi:L-amino acid N-acyltransferase YncA
MIRSIKVEDAKSIAEIYNYYIVSTVVTFEVTPVSTQEMEERILASNKKLPWLVYEKNSQIIGYAYATDWKTRSAYKQTVETTIYIKANENGKGIGCILYSELINQLRKNHHAIIGGISLPNEASIALHEKLGFQKVAHFNEVGFKFNKWIDVGYWELLINI